MFLGGGSQDGDVQLPMGEEGVGQEDQLAPVFALVPGR